jgi:UDP-glucose 4-epimerase
MNILVTGGLGANGSWVTWELLRQGHKVVVFDTRPDGSFLREVSEKAPVVVGDIQDIGGIIGAIREHKIECIVHVAAILTPNTETNPLASFRINALGTVHILEAARIMGVKRVVFASSKGVYSPFVGEYGYPTYKPVTEDYPKGGSVGNRVYSCTKTVSEQMGQYYHERHGIDFLALRFPGIYGVGKRARNGRPAAHTRMIENAMLGKPTRIERGGDEKDDMLYIKDLSMAAALACVTDKVKYGVYNIGIGKAYTLGDVGEAIKKVYPDAAFEIGPGLDYVGRGPIYCVFDISRARKELGYEPRYGLEEGVRDYIETMKQLDITPRYSP